MFVHTSCALREHLLLRPFLYQGTYVMPVGVAGKALQLITPLMLQQHAAAGDSEQARLRYSIISATVAAVVLPTAQHTADALPLPALLGEQMAAALPQLISAQLSAMHKQSHARASTEPPQHSPAGTSAGDVFSHAPEGMVELLQQQFDLVQTVIHHLGHASPDATEVQSH